MLAEDETLLRAGLSRLLADEGHDVVGTAGDLDEPAGQDEVPATGVW